MKWLLILLCYSVLKVSLLFNHLLNVLEVKWIPIVKHRV